MSNGTQYRLALPTHGLHRKTHKERHKEGLQHRAFSERGKQRIGNNGLDKPDRATTVIGLSGIFSPRGFRGLNIKIMARLNNVAHGQPHGKGKRGHGDEIPEGNTAGFPHTRGGPHRANAQHNGAENHRRDHHLNEIDEHGA